MRFSTLFVRCAVAVLVASSSIHSVLAEATSGSLFLKTSSEDQGREALRVSTSLKAQITGNLARVHVRQTFVNDGNDWVEGLYVFPLAADAAVDELLLQVDERTIRGEIQEKSQAKAQYSQARSEGRQASIVEQQRPNLFSTAVANIAPHAAIAVDISYLETIPFRDSRYTLRLPLAITPRYTPGAAETAMPVTGERVTAARQQVDIDITLSAGFTIASAHSLHHAARITGEGERRVVRLEAQQVAADRDFELTWTPAASADVATAAFAETVGDETYTLLLLTPPGAVAASLQPRAVTFIIDTSGSMQGPSIEQASAALQMGVDRLKAGDRFNIVRFASDCSSLFAEPQPVTDASRASARHFIDTLRADGGTEMRAPLERAMAQASESGFLQQIVFITDGSVGNEAELIELIHRQLGASRLFTIGIGAAPNSYFLEQAAKAGRGSYTFIADRSLVGPRMQDLFQKLESPSIVDLAVSWGNGVTADFASAVPGDVYAGDPVVMLARLDRLPAGAIEISGHSLDKEWTRRLTIVQTDAASGIAKLWARERIADLSRQLQFGGDRKPLESQILALALNHHLVSDYTSLVAIDQAVVRPDGAQGHTEQAPTAAPTGSYWATTGFAKTATPAGLLFIAGVLLLSCAAVLYSLSLRARVRP